MKNKTGPTVRIKFSCADCKFCKSEHYVCQGDSGNDVFCEHPSFEKRKKVGDTAWDTPDFCPYKKEALLEKIKSDDFKGSKILMSQKVWAVVKLFEDNKMPKAAEMLRNNI